MSCQSPLQCRNLNHYTGVFDEEEAEIKWKPVKPENLSSTIAAEVQQERYFGFVFIKCSNSSDSKNMMQSWYDEEYAYENYVSYTQLFVHAKKFPKVSHQSKSKDKVNLNLIMIDSVSRTHFYRSLPKTVKFLESLHDEFHPKVFDFQYLQAVKQRTYESLQALFSGYVNTTEIPFGIQDIPRKPLPISDLFGPYKKLGYKTLWLEDLCWNWEWGLSKDLKVVNATLDRPTLWQNFKKALKNAKIDGVDVTLASCDILQLNGKKDPFHDLPAVCFNGQHHHEYTLDYLQQYQIAIQDSGHPFLTFSMSNVAHDETGLRVQTIDEPMSRYLKFAERLKNTITIVFSDHGNTYGDFIQTMPEAHIETFHPFLFVIVPQDVQNLLGDVQMRIFRDNEQKLVSLIDVHNMLIQLIGENSKVSENTFLEKYYTPGGLLTSISSSRTCNDIPLLQPNLCICRNFEVSVEPADIHMALADFGVGVLSNLILQQHKESGAVGFGNCRPLRPVKLRNVKETRVSVDLTRYKLDVVVKGMGGKSDKYRELLFLTLEAGSETSTLRLVSYERMSLYATYSVCQDQTVELKLCLCDLDKQNYDNSFLNSLIFGALNPKFNLFKKNRNFNAPSIEALTGSLFGISPTVDFEYPSENPCLYTVIHSYKSGIVLVGANFCSTYFTLELFIEAGNLNLSCEKHSKFLLHAGDVKMMLGGVAANPKVEWHWHHNIRIQYMN